MKLPENTILVGLIFVARDGMILASVIAFIWAFIYLWDYTRWIALVAAVLFVTLAALFLLNERGETEKRWRQQHGKD